MQGFAKSRFFIPALGALLALGIALGYFWLRSPETSKIKVGMLAPDLELPSVAGDGGVKLSSFKGQAILLVFFMSDCHLCREELPQIERISKEYRRRNLLTVGVSVDKDYAETARLVNELGLTFGLLRDPNGVEILKQYGSYKMPEAYLIDVGGTVRAVWLGRTNWQSREVKKQIEDALPKP
jgi:peroxiredoxin